MRWEIVVFVQGMVMLWMGYTISSLRKQLAVVKERNRNLRGFRNAPHQTIEA